MKKRNIYKYLIMFVFSVISIVFVYNDYFLYKTPILKITSIVTKEKDTNREEKFYNQYITGIIQNGKYKGKEFSLENQASTSQIWDETIKENTELFVSINEKANNSLSILNIKRDKYLVILFVIFIDLVLIIAKDKGLKSLISLFVNIIITIISIYIFEHNSQNINMLLLYIFVSIIFIISSLYITNGKSKKTLASIISSIISLFVSFSFSFLIIKLYGKNLFIWNIEYIEAVYDYENFFYVNILLCGLGAIMDIAITEASSLSELIEKNKKISHESLIKSGWEISKDVVGTMSNVMLYTIYTPIVPTLLIVLKNSMSLATALRVYGNIDFIVVLCSCISIVLAIPISLYTSIFVLSPSKKEVKA